MITRLKYDGVISTKDVPYFSWSNRKLRLIFIFILFQLGTFIVKPTYEQQQQHDSHSLFSSEFNDDINLVSSNNFENFVQDQGDQDQDYSRPWARPTPPLQSDSRTESMQKLEHSKNSSRERRRSSPDQLNILPSRVYTSIERYTYGPNDADSLHLPVFNLQSIDPILYNNMLHQQQDSSSNNRLPQSQGSSWKDNELDTGTNNFDINDSGSGNWESAGGGIDENGNILEDSATYKDAARGFIQPTPILSPNFHMATLTAPSDPNDRPPLLNRRLPKLVATAGQVYKFFIPAETFLDEDGDLAQLKTTIVPKISINRQDNHIDSTVDLSHDAIGHFNSWLQYDSSSQLLYGFPSESQAGTHEYNLMVSDRWGQTSNETFEIHVRQHQSTRAFTHLIVMNQVRWNLQKYPTLVDALGEFVRKMTTQVFNDQVPYKNFVARYYNLENVNPNSQSIDGTLGELSSFNSSFTIAWSNASIPVHPCNLSYIESLSKNIIGEQIMPSKEPKSNANSNDVIQFEPASNLVRALDYEFRPTSVSIYLQGACEGKSPTDLQAMNETLLGYNNTSGVHDIDNSVEILLRVRIKIGRMTWKLGEPFEYQIPNETFELGKNLVTRELQLTVHTIDGMAFDSDQDYNFLEFDRESQTLFGSPYSQEYHVGQRELQLTGRHLKTGQKVHEVFILNIEQKDLTTINNRAFRMSLYVGTRTGFFGPKERVTLSYKMRRALEVSENDTPMVRDRIDSEFVVIDIQKFSLGSKGQADKIERVADNSSFSFPTDNILKTRAYESSFADHTPYGRSNYMYKYTWTDEKIGFRGDCPVEVIKENIIYALERGMMEYNFPETSLAALDNSDDSNKNTSEKFYERLKLYFEPDLDLFHLRFEPLNACIDALELHDVGNMDLADSADKASEYVYESEQSISAPRATSSGQEHAKPTNEINSDEYWSIIVLIVLVLALSFVMLMFFLGMQTYRINQDKRFELQVRLAQARQNSMFLSSMMLADQATADDINRMVRPSPAKSMYIIQDEDKGARKPVILDNERQVLVCNNINTSLDAQKPTAVQLNGSLVHTAPLRPNMTFTLDSISSWQPQTTSIMMNNPFPGNGQQSMTLHRRTSQLSGGSQAIANRHLQHSQSILTVASIGGQTQVANLPVLYGPLPVVEEIPGGSSMVRFSNHTASLPRGMTQRRLSKNSGAPLVGVPFGNPAFNVNDSSNLQGFVNTVANGIKESNVDAIAIKNGTNNVVKLRSPSFSSSNPTTPQSVISNPNYLPQN